MSRSDKRYQAEIERLHEALRRIAMHASGGLCYFGAEAKHAQLKDIAYRCQEVGFAVPGLGPQPEKCPDNCECYQCWMAMEVGCPGGFRK